MTAERVYTEEMTNAIALKREEITVLEDAKKKLKLQQYEVRDQKRAIRDELRIRSKELKALIFDANELRKRGVV